MASAGVALSPVREARDHLSLLRLDGFRFRSQQWVEDSIRIYLSVSCSSVMPMRILKKESIASMKLRIKACRGFVVGKEKLIFDGVELARDDCLVRDYGVGGGNALHLVLRMSNLQVISIRNTSGQTFEFEVGKDRDVGYIKEEIARRGKDMVDRRLLCDGEEGEDQPMIDDITRRGDALIHLLVKRTAKVRTMPLDKDLELSIVVPNLNEKAALEELRMRGRESTWRNFWLEHVVGNAEAKLAPQIKDLVRATFAGLEKGNVPVSSTEGSGGAYFMPDVSGSGYVAVFKPTDEEPLAINNPQGLPLSSNGEGLKKGTCVGEGALREVAAYILDHPSSGLRDSISDDAVGFSGVPPTTMVCCLHEGFNHPGGYGHAAKNFKIGSLQRYANNHGSCEEIGPGSFPDEEVHKITILDIRLANADRHAGNILFYKTEDQKIKLIPIDHGYCLTKNFEDCTFDWLYWPQARQKYNSEAVNYIRSLDAEKDISLLNSYGWNISLECARTLRISTMLLKKGVMRGLSPFTIGKIMCRETIKKKSMIEEIVLEAEDAMFPGSSEAEFMEAISKIMDRHLDGLTP